MYMNLYNLIDITLHGTVFDVTIKFILQYYTTIFLNYERYFKKHKIATVQLLLNLIIIHSNIIDLKFFKRLVTMKTECNYKKINLI